MSKYYSIPIKIISFVTLFAFISTQVALGYEGQSLSREPQKSHLRLQQPDKSDIGPALASALGGQFKQVEHSDLVTISAVEDLVDTIPVKSNAIGENYLRAGLNVFLGIFGGIGAGILTQPNVAITTFTQIGWFLMLGFIAGSSLIYTIFAAKEKRFKVSLDWFFLKLLFAVLIPCSAITIGLGLSHPVFSPDIKEPLSALFKSGVAPLSMGLIAVAVVLLNVILYASKYFAFKASSDGDWLSLKKFTAKLVKFVLVIFFASFIVSKIALLLNPALGSKLNEFLTWWDACSSNAGCGLGLVAFVAPIAFILGNVIAQVKDISDSRKLVKAGKLDRPKVFDYRRVFLIAAFFSVFGSIFFSRLMEFYSALFPKTLYYNILAPIAYEMFFLPPCFIFIIIMDIVKDIFTRDVKKHPDWLIYAKTELRKSMINSLGIDSIILRGLMIYVPAAIFILGSPYSGGSMLLMFNMVDFSWAIVLSFFLQSVMNGNKANLDSASMATLPAVTSELIAEKETTADATGVGTDSLNGVTFTETEHIAKAIGRQSEAMAVGNVQISDLYANIEQIRQLVKSHPGDEAGLRQHIAELKTNIKAKFDSLDFWLNYETEIWKFMLEKNRYPKIEELPKIDDDSKYVAARIVNYEEIKNSLKERFIIGLGDTYVLSQALANLIFEGVVTDRRLSSNRITKETTHAKLILGVTRARLNTKKDQARRMILGVEDNLKSEKVFNAEQQLEIIEGVLRTMMANEPITKANSVGFARSQLLRQKMINRDFAIADAFIAAQAMMEKISKEEIARWTKEHGLFALVIDKRDFERSLWKEKLEREWGFEGAVLDAATVEEAIALGYFSQENLIFIINNNPYEENNVAGIIAGIKVFMGLDPTDSDSDERLREFLESV